MFIFVSLMILDHLAQEIMRLLVVFEYPLIANLQFFIRNGLWVYVYLLYYFISTDVPFHIIWYFWIAAEIISIFFIVYLFKKIPLQAILKSKSNYSWVLQGLKICFPLLVSTLSLRGIFTADRYILGFFDCKEIVGVYSYFSSFSSSVMAFIDAGVVMLFYPKLIKYYKSECNHEYENVKRKFLNSILITSILISVVLLICVPMISKMTGKNDFLNSISLFYIMLLGSVLYCISLVYHFDLYARNLDKFIIKTSVVAFGISFLLMIFLGYLFSATGIAISQLIGIIILLFGKYRYSKLG
ncbi:TPA: lipopolysaccharide biosynthesis protein [Citrobacter koseri]|uniref:lipopolysaccharide biosynthesis protein n=1 Tax=Citrobacter sp. CK198 TaxID=2985107 RepID=UPI0025776135|nr:hypothetical protein [Citrobacter sp. CK198]MDM2974580.1 hypothetical protein [Citrobacter sp. CK198]